MRILLVSYHYPPLVGGVERQSHLLTKWLVGHGHQVRVVSARLAGSASREVLDGVSIQRVSPGRGSRWQKMATFLAGMLMASARSIPWADLVHVQQALYPAAALALVQPLFRRPLVVRNSGSGEFGGVRLMQRLPLGAFGLAMIARHATGVSLNAEMTREMHQAGFRRVVEIPNGVEVPPAATPALRAAARERLGLSGRVVVYAGRLEEEKGVDVLIHAWRQASLIDTTLVIVGDGARRGDLERLLAADTSSARTVTFRGSVANVSSYYTAADLFVLPSRSEGISNALLEAMAHSLPVVATAVGGNRQVLDRDDLGCLVPAGDPAALATALRRLLDDASARARYARNARAHIEQHYAASRMVERFEQLYAELVGERAG